MGIGRKTRSVQDKECLLLWPSPRKERAGCWQREKSKICLRWNMNWLPEKCLGKRKLSQSPETTELKILGYRTAFEVALAAGIITSIKSEGVLLRVGI